jgi:lactoylglutathione lyase
MEQRLVHTMIRIVNLEKSLDFYTRLMGMEVLRKTDYPEGRFTNVFLGYGSESRGAALELTFNWDRTQPYEKGSAWGHLAFEVQDLEEFVGRLRAEGVKVTREPGPMKGSPYLIAFVRDPDDYAIELLERREQQGA